MTRGWPNFSPGAGCAASAPARWPMRPGPSWPRAPPDPPVPLTQPSKEDPMASPVEYQRRASAGVINTSVARCRVN